jgi:hypothetical protein
MREPATWRGDLSRIGAPNCFDIDDDFTSLHFSFGSESFLSVLF